MNINDCSSVYVCEQKIESVELLTSLLAGVLFSISIWWCARKWTTTATDSSIPKINNTSECLSASCVRCHSTKRIQNQALEQLIALQESNTIDISCRVDFAMRKPSAYEVDLQRPNVLFVPNLNSQPWFDERKTYEDDLNILKNSFYVIKEEFDEIYRNKLDNWIVNTVPTGEWSVLYLKNQGRTIEENCRECPKTREIICKLNNVMNGCVFENVAFSVLQPGTVIDEHYGPTNARIRCHLGLVTPTSATLCVGNEERTWKSGDCRLFDDSFLHSARHDGSHSTGIRAVLIVDFWNPSLTTSERKILQNCYAAQT